MQRESARRAFKFSCAAKPEPLYWILMLPRLLSLEWGSFVVHLNGYGFAVFCGTLAALLIALRRATDASLPRRPLIKVFAVAVAGLFAGAKFAYALQYGIWSFPGGWVFYGGMIGGTAAALVACRRWKLPPLAVADLGVPCALLAAAFGRVGCFFAGCCYGTVWDGGVCYPARSHAWKQQVQAGLLAPDALRSLPTVPAPLLEAAALLAIFVVASFVWRRRGRALATCGLLYAVWRFIAEFWRGDNASYWGWGLTFSQGISLALLAGSIALLRARPRSEAAPARADAGWPVLPQVATILLAVAVLTGGVGCSAKQRQRAANEIGEAVIDETGDCIGDCIGDCTSACIDDCTETNCRGAGNQNGERTAADPDPKGPRFRLPPLETGRKYSARLSIQGVVNVQDVALVIEGEFQAYEKEPGGVLPIRVLVSRLDLRFGSDRISSPAGELWIRVSPTGSTAVRNSTLPNEVVSVLKAMEPVNHDFFEIETTVAPQQRWSDRLHHELEVPDPRAECQGELVLGKESHPFQVLAFITRTPGGERRVHWLLRR